MGGLFGWVHRSHWWRCTHGNYHLAGFSDQGMGLMPMGGGKKLFPIMVVSEGYGVGCVGKFFWVMSVSGWGWEGHASCLVWWVLVSVEVS